jgi:hypothetical protein
MSPYQNPYKLRPIFLNFDPKEPNPSRHRAPPIHRHSPQLKPGGGCRCKASHCLLGAEGHPHRATAVTQARRSRPTTMSHNRRPLSRLLP